MRRATRAMVIIGLAAILELGTVAAQTTLWVDQFGTSGSELVVALAATPSGVYAAGSTDGTLPGQTSSGSTDAYVRKYDSGGSVVWTRQFGTSGFDAAIGVAASQGGGAVYVFGATSGALPGQTFQGGPFDAFLRKYDRDGSEVWTREFGTASNDVGIYVAATANAVYVTGYTEGALPGQTNAGSGDVFVRKYDRDGTELWTREFGSTGFDFPVQNALAVSSSGVYVCGVASGALPGQTSISFQDSFIRKYDLSGTELWTHQFGTADGSACWAVAAGPGDSGVYVVGDVGGGALPGQTALGGVDAYVRKYDAAGTEVWTRQFGTADEDLAMAVDAGPAGPFAGGLTFGAFPGETNLGNSDAFLRAYDTGGSDLWTTQFGTSSYEAVLSVAATAGGSALYAAGYTQGTLPGQTTAGGRDAFVMKLSV